MLEEAAHCGDAAAGARLQRKTHHDELRPPVHHKVIIVLLEVRCGRHGLLHKDLTWPAGVGKV